jgi:hypothetical protein
MRGMMLVLVNALIAIALLSCAAPREPIIWEEIKDGRGVLILSAGATSSCIKYTHSVFLEPSGGGSAVAYFDPHDPFSERDFDEVRASVDAVALAPGEYEIFFHHLTRHFSSNLRVRLSAGEVVYAGEIWLEGCELPIGYKVINSWERDKTVVAAEFPDLPLHLVQMRPFEYYSGSAGPGEN